MTPRDPDFLDPEITPDPMQPEFLLRAGMSPTRTPKLWSLFTGETQGSRERGHITRDDMTNLKISLGITESVDDFLKQLN